jgi:putative iron-regulated protein
MLAVLIAGCGGGETEEPVIPDNAGAALSNYAEIVHASYMDSLTSAEDLEAAISTFVAAPTEANLTAAKDAWLASREPYLQTEVYRFYDGPIDDVDGPEGALNAWPMDESYVDYTVDDANSGIVNDDTQDLAKANLATLNDEVVEENVATGYHAVEFLLWGQDLDPAGPGARPATDYATDGTSTAANPERRGTYLVNVTDLMTDDLESLVTAWAPDASNYRADFLAAEPKEGLRRVLTGMIILSGFETGGERLQAALDSGDQEDEHSCFSDNTHRDMIQDIQGIQNVYLGSYTKLDGATVSGTGIKDVIAARDADLAGQIEDQIAESLRLANALNTPFDQEIALGNDDGRARVAALITSLRAQEDLLEDAFRLFELTIPEAE